MTHVVLDLTPLSTTSALRGIGRYVRGLVQGLRELGDISPFRISGVAAQRDLTSLVPVDDVAAHCEMPARAPLANSDLRRNFIVTMSAQGTARDASADLLHLTDPKGLFFAPTVAYTLTSHDLIPLVLPELYLPSIPGWDRLFAAIERFRYRGPRRILAISHATKNDLCAILGVDPERVDVVWHGVDHTRFHTCAAPDESLVVEKAVGGAEPYLFYLGAGDGRKDLGTLVAAYARAAARHEARLVIAGRLPTRRVRELAEQIRRLGLERRVSLLGPVDESLVPALYRRAALHVFPSRYEGFGLPVLEALACGVPTITSPGSALDEVAGDAATIVPVAEPDALSSAIDGVYFDSAKREAMRARGLDRAKGFTWKACAAATLEFWKKAAET